MIRKLRMKLVAVAMLSLLLVLSVIMTWLNVKNYRGVIERADNTLVMLRDRNAVFPGEREKTEREQITRRYRFRQFPNEARFFHVQLNPRGEIEAFGASQIADPDGIDIAAYVQEAEKNGGEQGFASQYRFIRYEKEGMTHYIFLDCSASLDFAQEYLRNSIMISVAGFLTVLLLLIFFSGRIIKPVAQSYEKQKRFITDAGHELKTPVTIIDADAELLEAEVPDNEWLADIRTQTGRLSALTHDLIYLSRLDEKNALVMIEFPLSEAVAETAAGFQAPARTRGLTLETEIQPMISFRGDENSILRLVSILLDNAVKYAEDGGTVRLHLESQGKRIVLWVENSVKDMDRKTMDNMFERFYRADSARGGQQGYGIGLSIARAIAESHRGKISAALTEDRRLVMTVTLPGYDLPGAPGL